jgi:hypothetical protein
MARTTPVLFPGRTKDFTRPVLPLVDCKVGKKGEGRSSSVTEPAEGFRSAARGRRRSPLEALTSDRSSTPFVSSPAAQLLSQLFEHRDFVN